MKNKHKRLLNLGNHMRNLMGQPYYKKAPNTKKVLEEILNAMAQFTGTAWAPVSVKGGYNLMLNQCPGACGYVWELNIKDEDTVNWLVNEINQRRHGENKKES